MDTKKRIVIMIGIGIAFCAALAVWANEVFDAEIAEALTVLVAKNAEIARLEAEIIPDAIEPSEEAIRAEKMAEYNRITLYKLGKELRDKIQAVEPKSTPVVEPSFTDRVQESIKGVVHIEAPSWQGSGFVIGPNIIGTARHCVDCVEDFLITTADGHKLRATRAIRDKKHDVAAICVDDLKCVNEDLNHRIAHGGKHDVVLVPLPLGSIKDCVLGQGIYVIGSPYGKKHFNAVTTGIFSMAKMDVEDFDVEERYGWSILFMTDAATWGGSSGGPVFSMDGVVRGVLVGGHNQEENTSYCVPVDVFLNRLEAIKLAFVLDCYGRELEGQTWEEQLREVYMNWPGAGVK